MYLCNQARTTRCGKEFAEGTSVAKKTYLANVYE